MVPKPLIRLTYLVLILRIIMSPWSSTNTSLYYFVKNQGGFELMMSSITHFQKLKIAYPNRNIINVPHMMSKSTIVVYIEEVRSVYSLNYKQSICGGRKVNSSLDSAAAF
jgi:hypothetical protein